MLLNQYKEQELIWQTTFLGEASTKGIFALRGELIIKEGNIEPKSGKRLPPELLAKQIVTLEKDGKLTFLAGFVHKLEHLPLFLQRYKGDFALKGPCVFYVENISKEVQTTVEDISCVLLPIDEGLVWNEMMEELYLEKGDFKGQTPEDKVVTMAEAMDSYKPKYETVSYEEAEKLTFEVKKEARGPV